MIQQINQNSPVNQIKVNNSGVNHCSDVSIHKVSLINTQIFFSNHEACGVCVFVCMYVSSTVNTWADKSHRELTK